MINKYLDRLESLICLYRESEFIQFESPGGEKADFDDLVWHHIDPNSGRNNRFLCGIHGKKGRNSGNLSSDALPYPYSYLIKIWVIETINTNLSVSEKKLEHLLPERCFHVWMAIFTFNQSLQFAVFA